MYREVKEMCRCVCLCNRETKSLVAVATVSLRKEGSYVISLGII